MKKWTKALSAFVVATVMSTGLATVTACGGNKDDNGNSHNHNYVFVDNGDGTHSERCNAEGECDQQVRSNGAHVDENNDGKCDDCAANVGGSTVEKVTITFKDGDSVLSTKEIDKGGKVSGVAAPEKANYDFAGWFESADFSGNPVNLTEKTFSANATLYAKFEEKSGPVVDDSIFGQLSRREDKLLAEDFTGKKNADIKVHNGTYGTAGVYVAGEKNVALVDGDYNIEDDALLVGIGSKTHNVCAIADFGMDAAVAEGYFEFTMLANASGNYNNINFVTNDPNKPALQIMASGNGFMYGINGIFSNAAISAGGKILTAENAVEAGTNTVYKVYFKINTAEGKLTLKINDVAVFTEVSADIGSVVGLSINTSNGGQRQNLVDNIVVCGTAKTIADHRAIAQRALDNAYAALAGANGTHTRNAAAIKQAYDAIDLAALDTAQALNVKVAEFAALGAQYDSDAAIAAEIAKLQGELSAFVTEQAPNYTVNKEAFDALVAKYQALDSSSWASVAEVAAKKAAFLTELAAISDDDAEAAGELGAKQTEVKAAVNAVSAPAGAAADVVERVAFLKADVLDEIENAQTVEFVTALGNKFNADIAALEKRDNLAEYKAAIIANIGQYCTAQAANVETVGTMEYKATIQDLVSSAQTVINGADCADAETVELYQQMVELLVCKYVALYKFNVSDEFYVIATLPEEPANTALVPIVSALFNKTNGAFTVMYSAIDPQNPKGAMSKAEVNVALETGLEAIAAEAVKLADVTLTISVKGSYGTESAEVYEFTGTTQYGEAVVLSPVTALPDNRVVVGYEYFDSKANVWKSFVLEEEPWFDDFNDAESQVVRVKIAEAVLVDRGFSWSYAKDGKTLPAEIVVSDATKFVDNSSKAAMEIKGGAEVVTVALNGAHADNYIEIGAKSTGNNNWSTIAVKGPDGNYVEVIGFVASDTVKKHSSENVYAVYGQSVSTLKFKAVAAGNYTIVNKVLTANTDDGGLGGISRSTYVTAINVCLLNKEEVIAVESATIKHDVAADKQFKVGVGQSIQLQAEILPLDVNCIESITWELVSAGDNIEINAQTGAVKGLKAGENVQVKYTITLKQGGTRVSEIANITVFEIAATGVQIKQGNDVAGASIDVRKSESAQLDYKLINSDGESIVDSTEQGTVVWSSSDAAKVTVDNNGKVTAVAAGEATITVTVTVTRGDQSTDYTQTVTVVVADEAATSISFPQAEYTLYLDGVKELDIDAVLNKEASSFGGVTWTVSGNEGDILTVVTNNGSTASDLNCLVEASQVGDVTITVSLDGVTGNNASASVIIHVLANKPAATTYTYTKGGTNGSEWTAPTNSNNSSDSPAVSGTKIDGTNAVVLTAKGSKITVSRMYCFSSASTSAIEITITLKDASGNVVGTIKGKTPTDKKAGEWTCANNVLELADGKKFATVEITCTTASKHASIVTCSLEIE